MPFSPTNFVNNQAPAITASQLNKLGTQHALAIEDVETQAADPDSTIGSSLGQRFPAKNEIVVNVMDYPDPDGNPVGRGAPYDDGPAILWAQQQLVDRSSFVDTDGLTKTRGGRIVFPQPSAYYYSPNPVNITQRWVDLDGQGSKADIRFVIGKGGGRGTTPNPVQQMNGAIHNFKFWKTSGTIAADVNAITIRNSRQYAIYENEFNAWHKAIAVEAPTDAAFHSNSSIRIYQNQFFTCDYHVHMSDTNKFNPTNPSTDSGNLGAAISDCAITDNIMNIARVSNIWIQQIDGIHVTNNVTFMTGYTNVSNIPANMDLYTKSHNIYIGSSNGVQIHNNNLFEAGLESILLEDFRGGRVTNNWCARPGQRELRSGIKVVALTNAAIEIMDNQIDLYTKYGIEVSGTPTSTPVPIILGNTVRFDDNPVTYIAPQLAAAKTPADPVPPAVNSISHAKVYFPSTWTGSIPDVGLHHGNQPGENIRLDFMAVGLRGYASTGEFNSISSFIASNRSFSGTGATVNIAVLKDAQGSTSNFGGDIYITAKTTNTSAARSAHYHLYVWRTATGTGVNVLSTSDLVSGAGATDPSFTFGITSGTLQATAVGATSGTFFFDFMAVGNVRFGA